MATLPETTVAPRFVDAALSYIPRIPDPQVPHASASKAADQPEPTDEFDRRIVPIYDGRPFASRFSLDRDGFELREHKTAIADFYDEEALRRAYYPEITRLVKDATGASDVFIFDHTLRIEDEIEREGRSVRGPVQVVHNDYTEKSAPTRVRELLAPEFAESYLANRFAQVNVWRSIGAPVQTTPIAVADAQSIAPEDLVPTELIYDDRKGEIYRFHYNPDHRWFYFPEMGRDEVLLLKGYDSEAGGTARFTAHTAFSNADAPDGSAPRESIEVRTLVSFGPTLN